MARLRIHKARTFNLTASIDIVVEIRALADEVGGLLQAGTAPQRRAALLKVERIEALSSTLALMLNPRR